MRIQTVILATIMVLCISTATEARYNGGTGEPNDPYLIATAEDLNDIGNHQEDWDKNFILVNDVNLAGYTGTQFKIIGNTSNPFTGVFNGNDHKIWNYTWTSNSIDYIGLFGCLVGYGGQIKNLGMENVNVNAGNGWYVGGLVGQNWGTITDCYSTGSISGTGSYVGGLVGYSDHGAITNSYSTGTVNGSSYVGGLVGYSDHHGAITNSYSIGTVNGSSYVGGLVGYNYGGMITNCYSAVSVTGSSDVGGLVGYNYCAITNCYSAGSVTGSRYVGGLVGLNYGTITSCYSTGSVTGSSNVGGLVGTNNGSINNCYSTGSANGSNYVGGLVGYNYRTITNCYSSGSVSGSYDVGGLIGYGGGVVNSFWDVETSGQMTSAGGIGKTTAEMKTASTYFGWNGCGEIIWTINDGNDYPRLLWEGKPGQPLPQYQLSDFLEGGGTQDDPYRVSTAEQLNLIGLFTCEWDKHFILVNDVDLAGFTGTQFNIIGTKATGFAGVFDGNDHKIWNFTWDSNDVSYIGLFECVGMRGQIKNLGMENVDVNAEYGNYVGGLVANNYGTIINCYSTGSFTGNNRVGGLVGKNNGSINNCYSTGSANGSNYVGGLVGYNYGTVTNCYSTGSITGGSVGGLVGYNYGTITNCYSAGSVTGSSVVGGLVGDNDNLYGTIMDCYSTGRVTGDSYLGGLVGQNWGTITNCCSTGSISGTGSYVGGLVGYNYRTITNCYSTGSVTGNNRVGGLVGFHWEGTILNCYATGSVSGNSYTGGLVGWNHCDGTISNCYATGNVLGNSHTGGLVGYNYEITILASFWDIETSGQATSDGGTGKTTAEMKKKSTFTDAGWDFVDLNGTDDIWDICEGTNYPKLVWQIPIGDLICPDGVNFIDYSFFAEHWLDVNCSDPNYCDGCDLDFSDTVDANDLQIFYDHWLEGG